MFGSSVLDVAIGVTFVFVFISVISSAVREGVESILKQRALDLERGIREILSDPDGTTITKTFFEHPLIATLFAGGYDPKLLIPSLDITGAGSKFHMPVLKRRNLPSYIPAANFAGALIDIVGRGAVGVVPTAAAVSGALSVDSLRATVLTLPNDKLQRAFLSALDYAKGDLDLARKNLEGWFDSSMDRVSGWYKRRTQLALFLIGLFAAVALNIDAITVIEKISTDQVLRKALVEASEKLVACRPKPADAAKETEPDAGVRQGDNPCEADEIPITGRSIAVLNQELTDIGLPIGWEKALPMPQAKGWRCGENSNFLSCIPGHEPQYLLFIMGWLITAFATMLGAPFWFDILNKLVSLRGSLKAASTGEAPPTSPPAPAGSAGPPAAPAGPPNPQAPGGQAASPSAVPTVSAQPNEWADGKEEGVL